MITADCNLDQCTLGRTTIFAFDKHRRLEAYERIINQVGAMAPPVWRGSTQPLHAEDQPPVLR